VIGIVDVYLIPLTCHLRRLPLFSLLSSLLSPLSPLPFPRPFHCSAMSVSPASDLERSEKASDEKNASYAGHAPVYVGENGEADAVEFVETKDLR
jgi:hypothetical protein